MRTLQAFYKAYAAWLDAGAPDLQPFDRRHGLCGAIQVYGMKRWHIKRQLAEAGLDTIYPFGGEYAFETEYDNATAHLNPDRIEWVRKHAVD